MGLGPLSATWCTLLLALVAIGAAVWLVASRVAAEYPALVTQVKHTTTQIQSWLAGRPFHIKRQPGEALRQPGHVPQPAQIGA